MRKIRVIVVKEFRQIFRNRPMLAIIFLMPVIQLLILANAASYEIKRIRFAVIDQDHTPYSRELTTSFRASPQFDFTAAYPSGEAAEEAMQRGDVDVILEIPRHFERSLRTTSRAGLSVRIDAINGSAAAVEESYVEAIVGAFNQSKADPGEGRYATADPAVRVSVVPSYWYNPQLNYKTFMVPGILVLLVTMVALFLSGMNIVREKELGTLEQINVTPIRKRTFVIGKLLPFWVLGMAELAIGLAVAWLVFGIPIVGNPALLFAFAALYLLLVLGMGLFISNFTETQQQAMFLSWFFAVIFILMSGLFTPIESMPVWAQLITEFNPVKYFVEVMRMVMLKGAVLTDILPQVLKLGVYAVAINILAITSYRKVR